MSLPPVHERKIEEEEETAVSRYVSAVRESPRTLRGSPEVLQGPKRRRNKRK
jgi:hypothetical protein